MIFFAEEMSSPNFSAKISLHCLHFIIETVTFTLANKFIIFEQLVTSIWEVLDFVEERSLEADLKRQEDTKDPCEEESEERKLRNPVTATVTENFNSKFAYLKTCCQFSAVIQFWYKHSITNWNFLNFQENNIRYLMYISH